MATLRIKPSKRKRTGDDDSSEFNVLKARKTANSTSTDEPKIRQEKYRGPDQAAVPNPAHMGAFLGGAFKKVTTRGVGFAASTGVSFATFDVLNYFIAEDDADRANTFMGAYLQKIANESATTPVRPVAVIKKEALSSGNQKVRSLSSFVSDADVSGEGSPIDIFGIRTPLTDPFLFKFVLTQFGYNESAEMKSSLESISALIKEIGESANFERKDIDDGNIYFQKYKNDPSRMDVLIKKPNDVSSLIMFEIIKHQLQFLKSICPVALNDKGSATLSKMLSTIQVADVVENGSLISKDGTISYDRGSSRLLVSGGLDHDVNVAKSGVSINSIERFISYGLNNVSADAELSLGAIKFKQLVTRILTAIETLAELVDEVESPLQYDNILQVAFSVIRDRITDIDQQSVFDHKIRLADRGLSAEKIRKILRLFS